MNEETVRRCVDAVVSAVLEPALTDLEKEAGQRISVDVRVAYPATTLRISCNHDDKGATATGEIRISLKESFSGAVGFSCQAIIRELMPSTGFSGFSLDGKIDLDAGGDKVRLKGRTNHYNQWDWRPELIMT